MSQFVVINPLKYSFVNDETGMVSIQRYATRENSLGNLWCSFPLHGMNFQQYWFDLFHGGRYYFTKKSQKLDYSLVKKWLKISIFLRVNQFIFKVFHHYSPYIQYHTSGIFKCFDFSQRELASVHFIRIKCSRGVLWLCLFSFSWLGNSQT